MDKFYSEIPDGFLIKIFAQPRSSKNQLSGTHGNALKIKLTAPPVGGAANKMCIDFLSKVLKVPKAALEITSGHSGRTKQVSVHVRSSKEKDRLIKFFDSF